jgi:hypothetical protein
MFSKVMDSTFLTQILAFVMFSHEIRNISRTLRGSGIGGLLPVGVTNSSTTPRLDCLGDSGLLIVVKV